MKSLDNDISGKLYDYKNEKGDIAILGGTFNPIHNGHLAMAEAAYSEYKVPVVLMPNKSTYYKQNDSFTDDTERLEMVRLASLEREFLMYSDMEIIRGGVTHTVDTIRYLKSVNPDRRVYFIIGGDSLEWIDRWVEAEELLSSMTVLSAVRGETDKERSNALIRELKIKMHSSDIRLIDMKAVDVSSTDIRRRAAQGESIKGLVPEKIEEYIISKNLYRGVNV